VVESQAGPATGGNAGTATTGSVAAALAHACHA
jgi:hypothetical protein